MATKQPGEKGKVEELMKPRYKVIADYPNCQFIKGDVLIFLDERINNIWVRAEDLMTDDCDYLPDHVPELYPHLFKPLQWWEERKPEEMPEYVKRKREKDIFKVFNVLNSSIGVPMFDIGIAYFLPADVEPCTETEYNNYLK